MPDAEEAAEPPQAVDEVQLEDAPPPKPGGLLQVFLGLAKVLFCLAVVTGLMMVATPKFSPARGRANIRACYANQKTIAGAVEMYNLDFNTHITSLEAMGPKLVKNGYLQSMPRDPGEGKGPMDNYAIKLLGNLCIVHSQRPDKTCEACSNPPVAIVGCEKHGPIQPYGEP